MLKKNALIRCVEHKNKKLTELIASNHSSIEPILGASFRSCLFAEDLEAAQLLLSKSKNKSKILNEKGDNDMTVLHYSLQKRTAAMLLFIVEELKNDDYKLDIKSNDNNEQKEMEQKEEEKKDDEKYEEKLDSNDNISEDIHPMYFMETTEKRNIFHILFAQEGSMEIIHILESVLTKDMIQQLLLRRDNADQLPLHIIATNIKKEIIEWSLDQFDDALHKFKMIAERNRYGESMWVKIKDKPLQNLFADKLMEYLNEIEFDRLDMIILKDTFRLTLKWRRHELQSLILSKMDKNKYNELLNIENMINIKQGIVTDLVDVDDPNITNVILSTITNEAQLLLRDGDRGEDALLHALAFAKGYNVIKLIMDRFTNKQLLFEFVIERTGGACPLFFAYRYKDVLLDYLLSFIPDNELHQALDEATPEDDDMNYITSLLARIPSKKIKYKMIRNINRRGETLFARAAWNKKREVLNWLLDSEIKDDEK
eukprot:350795_1